jgi:hypothetical protein
VSSPNPELRTNGGTGFGATNWQSSIVIRQPQLITRLVLESTLFVASPIPHGLFRPPRSRNVC